VTACYAGGILGFDRDPVATLIDAIDVKRKMFFETDGTPFVCLEAEVSTPTARGGQTLVRLKMRNLLTRAVFDKTFKASEKFKEPDLLTVEASYLYSDGSGFHFMDQASFETLTLSTETTSLWPASGGHSDTIGRTCRGEQRD